MNRILDVYFNNLLAGKLIQNTSGILSFQYEANYAGNENAHTISISLPIRLEVYEGDKVKAFFSGLLPDETIRYRLARYLGISEKNAFAMLDAIGGECAGAVSLYPEGQPPPKATESDIEILDDQKLHKILDLLKKCPLLAGEDGIRLSLAGAQNKIAVGIKNGQIVLIKGTTPTSHILKPVLTDIKDSVHNELFCMRLAKLIGIDAPHTEIRWLENTPYFLIERYDRIQGTDGFIQRLHQEDFCQALGIMPELKYEREGGPSVSKCLEILQTNSGQPAADCLALIKRVIFNYLIGNADAHGKNFSFLYKDSLPSLAPAYDLLCTTVYSDLSPKMAMKIGGTYDPNYVFLRYWHRLVSDTAAAKKNLEKDLMQMSNHCLQKSSELKLKLADEGITSTIFDDICTIIKNRANHIKSILKYSKQ